MNLLAATVRSWFQYGPPIGWRPNSKMLREYIALSVYLYVCFAALLLYKAAVLRGHHIEYAPYGLAVCKALLLAKFILIGRKLRIAGTLGSTLIHKIIYTSVVFLVFLVALSAIEVTIDAYVHHRTIREALAEGVAATPGEIFATCLLLLLVLIRTLHTEKFTRLWAKASRSSSFAASPMAVAIRVRSHPKPHRPAVTRSEPPNPLQRGYDQCSAAIPSR